LLKERQSEGGASDAQFSH